MTENSNPEFNPKKVKMIAGLGNPDTVYADTYHNAGFLAVDFLGGDDPETRWRRGDGFVFFKADGFVLVRPTVFMNESGQALRKAMKYFKVKPENMLLVHDDSDIEAGSYKIGFGRGAAGHRGVSSVIEYLKTKNFWRARIGVRSRKGKAEKFILSKITRADRSKMDSVFEKLKGILFA